MFRRILKRSFKTEVSLSNTEVSKRLTADDVAFAFSAFLGRDADKSELELIPSSLIGLLKVTILSSEFYANVVNSLSVSGRLDHQRFPGRPRFDQMHWLSSFEMLTAFSQERIAVVDNWRDLFQILFSDRVFIGLVNSMNPEWSPVLFRLNAPSWFNVFLASEYGHSGIEAVEETQDLSKTQLMHMTDYDILLGSRLFDSAFYILTNDDVRASNIDPIRHYLDYGAKEARWPSKNFNPSLYLKYNIDVADSGSNPLIHWLRFGFFEGRRPPFDETVSIMPSGEFGTSKTSQLSNWIRSSGMLDEEFYRSTYLDITEKSIDLVEHFINHGWYENRNPSPEFDTWYYKYSRSVEIIDLIARPLEYFTPADRLFSRPEGAVTLTKSQSCNFGNHKFAIHIHVFYADLIEEYVAAVKNMPMEFDLLISTCSKQDKNFIENITATLIPSISCDVRVVQNRGRDIAPFICEFGDTIKKYEFVCHLHTKRSLHAGFGCAWRAWLLDNLFGSREIVSSIIRFLVDNSDCGMLYPDNYFEVKKFIKWGANRQIINDVMSRVVPGAQSHLPPFANFPAGSMAWFRVDAIRPLIDANFQIFEFDEERGQTDLTLAHAIERALPLIVKAANYKSRVFYIQKREHLEVADRRFSFEIYHDKPSTLWPRDNPSAAIVDTLPCRPASSLFNPKELQINWIIPDFSTGAGGHMTIFRMVEILEKKGHRQTLWVQNSHNHKDPLAAKLFISKFYRPIGHRVHVRFLPDDLRQISGDIVVATDCWTVFPTVNVQNVKERFYFIQDYEPMFHPVGEMYLTAQLTYEMGLVALCAGKWLSEKAKEHGMVSYEWALASDPEFYYPKASNLTYGTKPRIAFYSRSYTPRRAAGLGLLAFRQLHRRGIEFDLVLFGEEPRHRDLEFPFKDLGILTPQELGDLYRNCEIGVVFSSTNYSLVPLEMMASGLPVVELNVESTRLDFPIEAITLAPATPNGIADSIENLLRDNHLRSDKSKAALSYVRSKEWNSSATLIEDAFLETLRISGFEEIDPIEICSAQIRRKRKAAIVIPTYNAGKSFDDLLMRVTEQKVDFDYEIFIIDSESTDGTFEKARSIGGSVRAMQISKSSFQHGGSRNLAISHTDTEFVALLTQDAMPVDDKWLKELIEAFNYSDKIGGVIGRHVAYDEHNRFTRRDIKSLFDRFAAFGKVYGFDCGAPSFIYPGGRDWRMNSHFYSDNNSAMRRSLWDKLPYPEIDWGEDQVWCWEMLKLGFEKGYADSAVVIHSHELDPVQQFDVGVHEGYLFSNSFGLKLHPAGLETERWLEEFLLAEKSYAFRNGIPFEEYQAYSRALKASIDGRIRGNVIATAQGTR